MTHLKDISIFTHVVIRFYANTISKCDNFLEGVADDRESFDRLIKHLYDLSYSIFFLLRLDWPNLISVFSVSISFLLYSLTHIVQSFNS